MTSLARIEARIEAGVAAKLWPQLLKMSVFKHCKHGWKHGCDCDFCIRKRQITTNLTVDAWYDGDGWNYERWVVFDSKRHWYRAELKKLRNEALEGVT